MARRTNSKRSERENIVRWIKILEEENRALERKYEAYENDVRRLVNDFIQQHGIDVTEGNSDWRNEVTQKEKKQLENEIADLIEDDITDMAKEEADRLNVPNKTRYLDYLILASGIRSIRLHSDTEKRLERVLTLRIVEEFDRQETLVGLDRQYIINHIDEAVRLGVQQGDWKDTIWGIHQKELHEDVSNLIRRSVVRGENPRKIARELNKKIGTSRYNAERLMRTEQASVQAQSQLQSYNAQDIYWYDLMVEPSACDICKDVASNNPHPVKNASRGYNIQPLHPNCLCSTVGRLE